MKTNIFFLLLILWIHIFISCNSGTETKFLDTATFEYHLPMKASDIDDLLAESRFQGLIDSLMIISDTTERQKGVNDFFDDRIQEYPLLEGENLVHFIYRNKEVGSVFLVSDLSEWNWDMLKFSYLEGTDLFYYSAALPGDTRLEYKFTVDGILIRDPGNSQICGFGDASLNSELTMPAYFSPPEIEEYEIPHGTVDYFTYTDKFRGAEREIWVYLPPGYSENDDPYPTVYFHDGSAYLKYAYVDNILDYLIYHNQIVPVIGVFVQPRSRESEYLYDDGYIDIICEELVPKIDNIYNTSHKPLQRGIVGFSMGGLAALNFTYQRHDIFGCCAAQSPAIRNTELLQWYSASEPFDARFYLDVGTFESWLYGPTLELAGILETNGFDGRFYGWNEYHSIGNWRAHLDEALKYFFPVAD